jgi:signal transduction histidine kinase/CheY-like chemotaxis protein
MTDNRRWTLIMSIAALGAVATLAALSTAVIKSQQHAHDDAIGRFDDRSNVAAQLLAGAIQQSVTQSRADAQARLSGTNITSATLSKYVGASGALLPYTALFDQSGEQVASYPPTPDAGRSPSGRSALRAALAGNAGTSAVIPYRKTQILELYVPYSAGAQGQRVLVTAVPVSFLRSYFGGTLRNAAGRASGGTLVADTHGHAVASNGIAVRRDISRSLSGVIAEGRRHGRIDGRRFAVQRVQDTGLVVGLIAPESELAAGLPSVVWPRLAIGGFALALVAVFALLARVLADSRRVGEARREAQRANEAKSRFLSHITHELKQPLASIMGFGEILLQRPDLEEADRAEYTRIIVKSGRNLEALVNELLDVSRIETGRVMLALEQVDVRAAVDEVFTLIQPLADERAVRLEAAGGEAEDVSTNAIAVADPMRLRQILFNLVSNAIKYNSDGGLVRVATTNTDHGTVEVAVTDEGEGMSAEDMAKLFQPFERLQAQRGVVKGTGLGLVITKGLVEAMDGHLEVASEPGTGSCFSFELRVEHTDTEGATPDVEAPAASELPGCIVYVDDEPDNLTLVEQILEASRPRMQLRCARTGEEGITLAEEQRPDLLVLDLNLPDLSGEQVLRRLRSRPETADVPILVLSADSTSQNIARLLETGADAYLTKPLDVTKFLDVVDRLVVAQPHHGNGSGPRHLAPR